MISFRLTVRIWDIPSAKWSDPVVKVFPGNKMGQAISEYVAADTRGGRLAELEMLIEDKDDPVHSVPEVPATG